MAPNPLGYVFWHWPKPEVSRSSYENKLTSFHHALNSHRPEGFIEALSFRIDNLPWAPKNQTVYEDWYLVKDFAAVGVLNEAAVQHEAREPHDNVAEDFMKGAGGLFRQVNGTLQLRETLYATYLDKPIGPSYQSYYDELARIVGDKRTSLWRRQLVLGPSPQFCVHTTETLTFPQKLSPFTIRLEPVGHYPARV